MGYIKFKSKSKAQPEVPTADNLPGFPISEGLKKNYILDPKISLKDFSEGSNIAFNNIINDPLEKIKSFTKRDLENWLNRKPNKAEKTQLQQLLRKEIEKLNEVIKILGEENSRLSHDFYKEHGYYNNPQEWKSSNLEKFKQNSKKRQEYETRVKELKSILKQVDNYKPTELKQLSLFDEAAMYQSNQPTFQDFYNYVIKNPKAPKSYFQFKRNKLRIPSDTILHDFKKHSTDINQWRDALINLFNIKNASISRKKLGSSPAEVALIRIKGYKDYGVSIQLEKDYNQIMTLFSDSVGGIDNWIKTSSARGLSNKPIASLGENPDSVVQPSQNSNNIINYIKEKIKPFSEKYEEILRGNKMNEELKKIKIYPKQDVNLDIEDEEEINEDAGAAAGGEAGGASFSQLGQAPTNPIAMVKVNGVPTAGKAVKKKKKKMKEDLQISNYNDPLIYGVDIKKLNDYAYEINFVGRQENHKDIIPIYIARGVMFDDGEWFSYPEVTDYVKNLDDEVKYSIMDQFADFKQTNKFDELSNIIKEKLGNKINEELVTSEVQPVESIIEHIISSLEFQPIEGGLGFNYEKEGNYTHILSYNKYQGEETVITVDYMIFDDNGVRFEKSWDLNSIEDAEKMEEEIYAEYESWE